MALGSTNPPLDSEARLLLEERGPEGAAPPPPGALLELLEPGAGALLELELELLLEAPPPVAGALAGACFRGCMAMAAIPVPRLKAITAFESADLFFI